MALSTALISAVGCEDTYVFPNEAPDILELFKPACYVRGGEEVSLSATATDADGDPIYYRWVATAGSFEPPDAEGPGVVWVAPEEPGPVTITVIVTDEIEESRQSTSIEVAKNFPVNQITNVPLSEAVGDSGYVYMLNLQPVRIPQGTTFTLLEGVRIVARGQNSGFEVDGTFIIQGTEARPVEMRPAACVPVPDSWAGITYDFVAAEGSISYLELTAADIGVTIKSEAEVTVSNATITNCGSHAIEVSNMAVAVITDCVLWDNHEGILSVNGYLTLERNSIRYNDYAGVDMSAISDGIPAQVVNCNVSNNGECGIKLSGYIRPTIQYNAMYSNGNAGAPYAVKLDIYGGYMPILAEDNYWGLGYDSEETIPDVIYDALDAPLSIQAEVDFIPWLDEMPPEVPNP